MSLSQSCLVHGLTCDELRKLAAEMRVNIVGNMTFDCDVE